MAAPSPDADLLSTHLPGMADTPAPDESKIKSRFRQKKLLVVLGTAALGGMLLGVAGMTLIAYLQPAAKEHPAPPVIVAPEPDPKQEALVEELKELKAKNEKLEEQLRLLPPVVPASAHDPVPLPALSVPEPAPAPAVIRSRPANEKEKVTADCTVPDKDAKLSEKLKSCIEGFNASTR